MKKVLKIIMIIVLIIVVLAVLVIAAVAFLAKEKSEHYYKYSNPAGELETEYTAMGTLEVSEMDYPSDDEKIGKFAIWYPTELESSDQKYPVVLWANGTGSTTDTYKYFLPHLSSWGFITLGNDDQNTRTGESLNAGIDLLIEENEDPKSVFYHKIDLDNIGIGGHSQGGPAVFNMASVQPNADMIKTVYAVSGTSSYHTPILGNDWEYDISKVQAPVFMTAGTGMFDAGTCDSKDQLPTEENGLAQGICPLWSLEENYGLLPNGVDKVYGRKTGIDHGETYLQWDGYMTAWFRYYLMNDTKAGNCFYGSEPELSKNDNYQDVTIYKAE